ncbi:MAG: penicillin-binding protein 2 [Prevotella shahii]|uniref:Penicillin-binding protein 2 n=4 Tax=Hoylesella shahii TaxID=228603 RepID=A0A318I6B4_9BACT|nr:penicillin-binding protein 2 [Hoylesella shahii]MBF1569155.1 penicillin-binding protein 2 [Hoylesella shahii]MBF1576081.1 penicillin-binding protein 2 [Hoylesella shahii]PXX24830.1 penicillin-binding protein 2 [Hoylesella shahii DSM 15611 = JCM 12083]
MKDFELDKRRLVIGGVAVFIVTVYLIRLFMLQLLSDDYKKNADSNAFLKKIEYPSRGAISDRHGRLLVYNQPAYDIMVVMNEEKGRLDTTEFCNALGITKEYFIKRMNDIKDRNKNPGYSRFTEQLFMSQLSDKEFSVFQEKIFRFPGFYVQKRSIRQYQYPYAAHVLGDVAEVSKADVENSDYYQPGDYIGKLGVERSYEEQLRGEKGVQILLRDAHGRVQGNYQNGKFDRRPIAGKDLTLSIDIKLQELGERLLEGKIGSIVAIEPATGEVLCMVSSPTYDPRIMVGRKRGKNHLALSKDVWKPLLNRSIMGQYPPGSTFKTTQGLTYMTEGIIDENTLFPCARGFNYRGLHVGCHPHGAPTNLVQALCTSCNSYFCWGLFRMIGNRQHYRSVQEAMNTWRDYMVSMGFGYKLGIDLPGEKRGLIPNAAFYDKAYKGSWNGLTIISISIGQGEVNLTPLQIANLSATIANRGYYYVPHVVRKVQGEPLDTLYRRRHYTMANRKAYEYVVQGMRASVVGGTCHAANRADYLVCGKTGTAQNRGQDHSVFMGFAPMDNPKIAIAVYVENGGFGATYGVPIGSLMMEQYINGKLSPASEAQASVYQSRRIAYGTSNR